MADDKRPTYHCPECGSKVWWDLTCHTYGSPETGFRACLPCDSATWWMCSNEMCHWQYTQGLNPRNPRTEDNERSRPAWLPARGPHEPGAVHPMGAWYEDDEEDA